MAKYYIYDTDYDIVGTASTLESVKRLTGDSLTEIKLKLDTKQILKKSSLSVKTHKIVKVFLDHDISTVGGHKDSRFTRKERTIAIERFYNTFK